MHLVHTARWLLSQLLRNPLTWLCLVISAAAWPALWAFTHLGTTTTDIRDDVGPLAQIVGLALLLGVACGTSILAKTRWFLAPYPASQQLQVEACALLTASLAFMLATLIPVLALQPASLLLLANHHGIALFLTMVHLVGIALVLLHLPLPKSSLAWLIPLTAWVLPALAAESGTLAEKLTRCCAALNHVLNSSTQDARLEGSVIPAGQWCPILGLYVAAFLLTRSPRPWHAIRNSG